MLGIVLPNTWLSLNGHLNGLSTQTAVKQQTANRPGGRTKAMSGTSTQTDFVKVDRMLDSATDPISNKDKSKARGRRASNQTQARAVTWKKRMMFQTRPRMMEEFPSAMSAASMLTSLTCVWRHDTHTRTHTHTHTQNRLWITTLLGDGRWEVGFSCMIHWFEYFWYYFYLNFYFVYTWFNTLTLNTLK